jgi:hypothetical protein
MVDEKFLDVTTWRAVDPKLMLAKLNKEIARLPIGLWLIDSGIAPVDLYAYLYARFGAPNGFGMTLKSATSDNLLHWHWSLQYEDRVIEFMGYTLSAQVAAEGSGEPTEDDVERLVRSLKADFANCGEGMSRERKRLERWTVFINPYCRLHRVVERFSERLQELDIRNVELPRMPRSEAEMQLFPEEMDACTKIYSEALGLSTSLRMLAPVLAESFVNLVIFVLVHPTTRDDSRLYDSLFRQEVDVRVRALHLTCGGFKKPVDVKDERFKNFQTLMQHRNDFLHGNIVPDKLAYREVYFDGVIPLPKKYENMAELALVNSLRHVEPETALSDIDVTHSFIALVLEAMHEKPAFVVQHFMETLDPGWRSDLKRAGILFPPNIVFAMAGNRSPNEDEVSSNPDTQSEGDNSPSE